MVTLHVLLVALLVGFIASVSSERSDPLLTPDTRNGVVHAVNVCMGERSVAMFKELRRFVISDISNEELRMASDYYLISFFNQYMRSVDGDICMPVYRSVIMSRDRLSDSASGITTSRSVFDQHIYEICRTHTFNVNPTDYQSSMDKIPMCLYRMINHVMSSAYAHV